MPGGTVLPRFIFNSDGEGLDQWLKRPNRVRNRKGTPRATAESPGTGWMPGHIEMQDTPPVMSDDEKAVEYAEGQRWHCEEIHCSNRFTMIIQKAVHRFAGSGLLGAFLIQRSTVRSEMSQLSIFSSP